MKNYNTYEMLMGYKSKDIIRNQEVQKERSKDKRIAKQEREYKLVNSKEHEHKYKIK